MTTDAQQIYQLIPKVMESIGAVKKTQFNQGQHYSFRGIEDIMNAVWPALLKHGVFYTPEIMESAVSERASNKGSMIRFVQLRVKFTFYAPDGSCICATVEGEGMDSGDKATNKAMSAAQKSALIQVFNIPTAELVDSEQDNYEIGEPEKELVKSQMTEPEKVALAAQATARKRGVEIEKNLRLLGCRTVGDVKTKIAWVLGLTHAKPLKELDEQERDTLLNRLIDELSAEESGVMSDTQKATG